MDQPLGYESHFRTLLHCITYLRCMLAPPGDQTSVWGAFAIPTAYLPFFDLFVEILTDNKRGLIRAVTGASVGHMWFWGVFQSRVLQDAAKAPAWISKFVAGGPAPSPGAGAGSDVHVARRE
jgi:Derlin-2/3